MTKLSAAFDAKIRERAERIQPAHSDGGDGPRARDVRALVLVVDDEPEITRSVAELLERDYQVLVANSADEALALLEENDVSVILADQRMPNGSGAELLARSIDVAPEVTRILFTGYSDISAVIEAVNKGQIYYYLAKPWMPEELQAVLSRGLERHRLVSENRELLESLTRANEELEARVRERTEQLETISRKDALTGLANRGWLDETLSLEVERSRRYGSRLSLIMGDLDHFKLVNDSYGHLVGDMVLKVAAEVLQAGVRMTDLVARYGGEEFLIVLPNTGLREACVLADRLREQLQNAPVTFRAEPVTGSFGVVEWRSGELASDTVGRADKAMYAAKEQGRNRVSCDPSVDQEMEERYGAGEPG